MRTFILTLAAIVLLASCSGIFKNISSYADKSVNFSNYKTYAWLDKNLPHSETPFDNEIVENNIENYVDKELLGRDLTPNSDTPDLLFELVLNDKEKVNITTAPVYSSSQYLSYPVTSYRYYNSKGYQWNQHRYTNYNYTRPVYQIGTRTLKTPYNHSTITIQVFARAENRMVWTGTAKGDVYDDNYNKNDIHPAIIKILNQYPIKSNSKNNFKW